PLRMTYQFIMIFRSVYIMPSTFHNVIIVIIISLVWVRVSGKGNQNQDVRGKGYKIEKTASTFLHTRVQTIQWRKYLLTEELSSKSLAPLVVCVRSEGQYASVAAPYWRKIGVSQGVYGFGVKMFAMSIVLNIVTFVLAALFYNVGDGLICDYA
ncbi:hypothetical protein FRC11_003444, partial [Ceratobasidium sp. 423]